MKRTLQIVLGLGLAGFAGCHCVPDGGGVETGQVRDGYFTTVFNVSMTGNRSLGMDENYRIVGQILPVRKYVPLNEPFELSRGEIISLSGVLTKIDKDHLRLKGHFKGVGPAGRPIDADVDAAILMGLHCGIHYFQDPGSPNAAAAGNDYLQIDKVKAPEFLNGIADAFKDYTLDKKSFTAEQLKMVEDCTTIKLPTGSCGMNMLYIRSQCIDPSFYAKIEIPKSSQEMFIQYLERFNPHIEDTNLAADATGPGTLDGWGNPIPVGTAGTDSGKATAKPVKWWTPGIIKAEKTFSTNRGDYVRAILSHDGGKLMLYLEWASI